MKKIKLVGAGLLLILIAMFLLGHDSPVTGITYVAGVVLLITGCFSWACKLHWYVDSRSPLLCRGMPTLVWHLPRNAKAMDHTGLGIYLLHPWPDLFSMAIQRIHPLGLGAGQKG